MTRRNAAHDVPHMARAGTDGPSTLTTIVMPEEQTWMPFADGSSDVAAFRVYHLNHPSVMEQLIWAAREAIRLHGGCDIHMAYKIAAFKFGTRCSRSYLPAFAREIERQCEDLRFIKRPSRFDRRLR